MVLGSLFDDGKQKGYICVSNAKNIGCSISYGMVSLSSYPRRNEGCQSRSASGTVEVDETYVGGKRRHVGRGYKGNKTAVIGALQRKGPRFALKP